MSSASLAIKWLVPSITADTNISVWQKKTFFSTQGQISDRHLQASVALNTFEAWNLLDELIKAFSSIAIGRGYRQCSRRQICSLVVHTSIYYCSSKAYINRKGLLIFHHYGGFDHWHAYTASTSIVIDLYQYCLLYMSLVCVSLAEFRWYMAEQELIS